MSLAQVDFLAKLRDAAQMMADAANEYLQSLAPPGAKEEAKTATMPSQLPQLDPEELAKLPWKSYRTKEPCKHDEAGWIFRDAKGAEALADLIEKHGKKTPVQIGNNKFECSFSGAEKQFIGRAPSK